MEKQLIKIFKEFGGYLLFCVSIFLMARTIAQYADFNLRTGFLAVKQEYIGIPVWLTAFYIHVFSSLFTLFAGVVQFSNYVLTRHKRLHRLVGLVYVFDVLIVNVPTGLVLAIYANGYLPSKIAFVVLDSLWFWFTLKALFEAKRRNFVAHRRYMIRSYALTCSAVTLRAWKFVLSSTFVIDPMTLYMIDAWLGFVPNLIFAEWLLRERKGKSSSSKGNDSARDNDDGKRDGAEAQHENEKGGDDCPFAQLPANDAIRAVRDKPGAQDHRE